MNKLFTWSVLFLFLWSSLLPSSSPFLQPSPLTSFSPLFSSPLLFFSSPLPLLSSRLHEPCTGCCFERVAYTTQHARGLITPHERARHLAAISHSRARGASHAELQRAHLQRPHKQVSLIFKKKKNELLAHSRFHFPLTFHASYTDLISPISVSCRESVRGCQ